MEIKKRSLHFLLFLISITSSLNGQDYSIFTETIRQLGSSYQTRDKIWKDLLTQHKIPFTIMDSVAFLYRGEATSVKWMGDFNGWGRDETISTAGTRLPESNIWLFKASFPPDARLDYKIVINGETWITDPVNPNQQWSGLDGGSPNSELSMPHWKRDPYTLQKPTSRKGTLYKNLICNSEILGYDVAYSLYVPHGVRNLKQKRLPILYVTDGDEYLDEQLGNMVTILDNLHSEKRTTPFIVVFVEHREPGKVANNRRMQELAMNPEYRKFFTKELIPKIESRWKIVPPPGKRGIMGTSLGGLNAAYFLFSQPDVFGFAVMQSPAFWYRPEIFGLCDKPLAADSQIYLSTGTIHDTFEGAEKMKKIFEKNACTFQYKEVHQGHSWGHWKGLISEALIYFFPAY